MHLIVKSLCLDWHLLILTLFACPKGVNVNRHHCDKQVFLAGVYTTTIQWTVIYLQETIYLSINLGNNMATARRCTILPPTSAYSHESHLASQSHYCWPSVNLFLCALCMHKKRRLGLYEGWGLGREHTVVDASFPPPMHDDLAVMLRVRLSCLNPLLPWLSAAETIWLEENKHTGNGAHAALLCLSHTLLNSLIPFHCFANVPWVLTPLICNEFDGGCVNMHAEDVSVLATFNFIIVVIH